MSTSLMYHGFGLVGYKYLKTEYKKGSIFFQIQKDASKLECPDCESSNVIRRGTKIRTFKTVPIGKKSVFLVVKIQRVECVDCGCIKQGKLNFADPKKTYTRQFERYILELSKLTTIKDVAEHLNVSWDTVKDIQKKYLKNILVNLS